MNSLFEEPKQGFEFIGNGFTLKKTSDKNTVHLYNNGSFVKEQVLYPPIEKRLFVVDMVERQGVMKTRIAASLGISRQSVDNWIGIYRKHGSTGLINNTKESWKKNPKRFTGNKARDLEQERREERQKLEGQTLSINFDPETEVEEKHCGPARSLYTEEFDYRENRYGGSMLYLGMSIRSFNFLNQLSAIVGDYLWLPLMFLMMHVNRISSIEQFKTAYKKEFGAILGLKQLWNLDKIRQDIGALIDMGKALQAKNKFIGVQISKGIVSLWRVFLDGHFVPYSGKEKVHKGYCTQRDLMMPGRTEFFAHDSSSNIVYFDIQEGKGDIHESLRQISQRLQAGNQGNPPLIVVDRELWGVDKFLDLSDCRFVTWEKNCDKAFLKTLSETLFTGKLHLNGKDYILFEENKTYRNQAGKSIELRRIISRNVKNGETFAIVTNDRVEDAITIAQSMLNRWGCSENSFKHMGTRTQMHYNPLWKIQQDSEDQQINNPEHTRLKKQLKGKKQELVKIQKELGKKEPALKKDGTPRESPVREQKIETRKRLEEEINQINTQISQCPVHIDLSQVNERKFKAIDNESKNWWNISGMVFWNTRRKLARLLYTYLPDNRDLLPVLDTITSSRGWIKSTRDTLTVRIEPIETPRYKDAQIQLCRHLNNQKIKLPNGKLLQYDVGNDPYSVQK
ncbi:MAG: helix-turn-helix domain-containing protein [Prolixibacteraceae bacterium]|nr:helix-turn-helix domain-containing protein [Prolixibacteraceae bacterium]